MVAPVCRFGWPPRLPPSRRLDARGGSCLRDLWRARTIRATEVRDIRRNGGGPRKRVNGVFPGRRQSFRHQRPKTSEIVLVRSPLLTSPNWREVVSSGRLVCRCHDDFLCRYVCLVLLRFRLYRVFCDVGSSPQIIRGYVSRTSSSRPDIETIQN